MRCDVVLWVRVEAPSARELSPQATEGERLAIIRSIVNLRKTLSPTRLAGPLTRPGPSVAARHLPTLWGVTLAEGAFQMVSNNLSISTFVASPTLNAVALPQAVPRRSAQRYSPVRR